jgi:hypothetical protein
MAHRKTTALEAALAALARGWVPLPIVPGAKRPLLAWEGLQHHAPAEWEVRDWYARWPDAGLGFVTGAVSGLVVLDVDPGHGGTASLSEIEAREGSLPDTIEAATGGGGRHLYFAHPGGRVGNRAGIAPGIDLRGDGGMIVAPPSLHPSGQRYRWRPGHAPGEIALAPLPGWLQAPPAEPDRKGHSLDHWRGLVHAGVAEGTRNSTIASLTGHLLWHGLDPEVVRDLMLCWNRVRCRPPLPDEEVARTVASIERTHARHDAEDGAS